MADKGVMTNTKLTAWQFKVLDYALSQNRTTIMSGRGGRNTTHVRAMAAKGLVEVKHEYTWETDWTITDLGRSMWEAEKARKSNS